MPNAKTIRQQVYGTQVLTLAPLKGSVISTTATAFQLNSNPLTTGGGYNGAANDTGGDGPSGVVPLSVGVTGFYLGTGRPINIVANGSYVTPGTESLTFTLYEVPASVIAAGTVGGAAAQTFTSWNSLGVSATTSTTGADGSFTFSATLQLAANGALTGQFKSQIASAATAAANTTAIAGLAEADLNFVLVATLTTGTATSVVTLDEFRIEA